MTTTFGRARADGRAAAARVEDVEPRAEQPPLPQRVDQGSLVDQAAPGGVHHDRAVRHRIDAAPAQQVPRLRGERHVQGEGVARRDQLVEPERACSGRLDHVVRNERVVDGHVEPERPGLAGKGPAEAPEAQHPEPLPPQPPDRSRDGGGVPEALPDRPVERQDAPRDRQKQRQRVVGRPRRRSSRARS